MREARSQWVFHIRVLRTSIWKGGGVFTKTVAATSVALVLAWATAQIATAQPIAAFREFVQYERPNNNDRCASALICDLTYSLSECRQKAAATFREGNFYLYRSSRVSKDPITFLAFGAALAARYEGSGCLGRAASAIGGSGHGREKFNASIVVHSKSHAAFFDKAGASLWSDPQRNKTWVNLYRKGDFHRARGPSTAQKMFVWPGQRHPTPSPNKPERPVPPPPTRVPTAAPLFTPYPPQDRANQVWIIIWGAGYVESNDGRQVCSGDAWKFGRSVRCTFRVPKGTSRTYVARSLPEGRFVRWNDDSSSNPSNVLTLPGRFDTRGAVAYFTSPTYSGPAPVRRPKPGESVSDN